MNRLYNLDYLRGLAASGIMIYHYLSWTLGNFSAESFIGRIGIYGVSIFYVLSGLTLFYVYYHKMTPLSQDVLSFVKKRIFRIFPLLWLVTIFGIVSSGEIPDLYDLSLNLTGLFGFIKWDTYFSVGVWSIGNELVFYAFFPFFILFSKRNKPSMIILSVVIFSLYLYFASVKLNPNSSLGEQWSNYANPLNQVFLFLGGFLIGLIFNKTKINNPTTILLLIFGLSLFFFTPAEGDAINLVTGINRLIFTLCCFLICFSFYKLTLKFPAFINRPLSFLGEASYSIYLLHPIVYKIAKFTSEHIIHCSESIRVIISVLFTLIVSYFTYEYFEKYFMKLGRRST